MNDNTTPSTPDPDRLVERLRPNLDELERERQTRRRAALRWLITLGGAAVAVAVAASVAMARQAGTEGAGVGVVPLIAGAILTVMVALRFQDRWRKRFAAALIPEICRAIDTSLDYQAEVDRSFVKPFTTLELVGDWSRGGVQHHIRGQYRERQFEMVHADLRARSGGKDSNETTVFQGLLFRIQTAASFEPGLCIRPNFGWFSRMFGKRAVPTGNGDFDSVFLVSPDDGSELDSERLNQALTPQWQDALLAIHESVGSLAHGQPKISAGLKYDALYLTVALYEEGRSFGPFRTQRARPFPEVGKLLASDSALERDLRKLIDDIGTFQRIIDRLPERGTAH